MAKELRESLESGVFNLTNLKSQPQTPDKYEYFFTLEPLELFPVKLKKDFPDSLDVSHVYEGVAQIAFVLIWFQTKKLKQTPKGEVNEDGPRLVISFTL